MLIILALLIHSKIFLHGVILGFILLMYIDCLNQIFDTPNLTKITKILYSIQTIFELSY